VVVTYAIITGMALGFAVIAVGTLAFVAGLAGLRSGRHVGAWSATLGVAGGVIAAGGLGVQHDVDAASWLLAPVVGALLSVVHGRVLFASGGPLRT
jgi:hypothetical protein